MTVIGCLSAPDSRGRLDAATRLLDHAASSSDDEIAAYMAFAKALAAYRQGNYSAVLPVPSDSDDVEAAMCWRLLVAMAQHRMKRDREALHTFSQAVASFDWRIRKAGSNEAWLAHILRREAEAAIVPRLPAMIAGTEQPLTNEERLALLPDYQFNNRHLAEARLCRDLLASDPGLEDSAMKAIRHRGACAAAAIGCQRGEKLEEPGADERARWRMRLLNGCKPSWPI